MSTEKLPRPPAGILLVEDDPLFARLMATLLEEDGHVCTTVASGAEAIDWLRNHRPGLVVTDYLLPDMTAEQLAEAVELPPFLVTTGAGSEQVAVNMMKLGARDYLAKDAGFMERLPKTVARVLRELAVEERLRAAEQSARETQARLNLVLEGSRDGFWDLDLARGAWFLSDRGRTVLGLGHEDLSLDRDALLARVHPEDRAGIVAAVEAHLAGNSPFLELSARVQVAPGAPGPGAWRWVLLRGRAVARNAEGRILRMAGTVSDATERKRAEESALRDRKMESLGQMAGGIAHDFNNLFQTLTTNLELISSRVSGDPRGRAALDRCFGILEKASALSRRMMDYSGGFLRAEEVIDLGALVQREVAALVPRLETLHPAASLACRLEEGLPLGAGDPGMLGQVVQALVFNGVEALAGGTGRVEVSLRTWQPGAEALEPAGWIGPARQEPGLCLGVRDTGCGIPADHIARIFDPFFTTKSHGRGMGLPAALGIVRSHGGHIHVESAPGRGTTFRVFLSTATGAGPEAKAEPSAPARSPGRVILLVDDEDDLRASLAEILTEILDFRVIEACDGVEAVERFREHAAEIALVIMDVTMPRMSGIQAWDEIRKTVPQARGILCSGYSEEAGAQLATGHGFLDFLKKPFHLQTLRDTIRRALPEEGA